MIICHHLVVDEITKRHGPEDKTQTTVRVKTGEWRPHIQLIHRFYAFYQFSALGSALLPNARLADLGYNTIIAIQSSAFLMTLFRKGLIRDYTHGFWYTLALIISFAYIRSAIPGYLFWMKILMTFGLRVKFGFDKYLGWVIFAIVSLPQVETFFFNLVTQNNLLSPSNSVVKDASALLDKSTGTASMVGALLLTGLAFGVYESRDKKRPVDDFVYKPKADELKLE